MTAQRQVEAPWIRLRGKAALLLGLAMLMAVCCSAVGQSKTYSPFSRGVYTNARLAFRYTPPSGMRDKTERFRSQIQQQAKASGATDTLDALLAMSSSPDSNVPNGCSVTIETYPRKTLSEPDDAKAEAQMSAWVAHSKDASALPRSVVISGQRFSVSVFGLQEGTVRKAAVVWTTVRRGKLLSFAFVANSPDQLKTLTESMKTLQFF